MMQENKVIWLEGMFLQPQHFQQNDRYVEGLIQANISAMDKNFWGFSKIAVDTQLLSLGKIGIEFAQGFFQDGTPINVPAKDHKPEPFLVPEGMDNTILYLGLPIQQQSSEAGNTASKSIYRHRVNSRDIKDNTADNAQVTEIQVGSVHCKILSDHDDKSAYHCLQFAKIQTSRSNQNITLDRKFLPTCLDVCAADELTQCISEFHGLLNHRAEMLAGRLTDTQQAGTAEIVDFMLLQLVNRYEPLFHYLNNKTPLHPEKLFLILIQLMGEMATFTNDKRRPMEPPVYIHEKPYETFKPVIKELRDALSTVLEQNATSIPLADRSHGLWVGQFPEKDLIHSCNFILAVYADLPVETIRTAFVPQVKIAPVEQIRTLVSRQLPGIDIQPIAVAPRQIPYHANFSYFSVNTRHELWKVLDRSGGVALHVGNHLPGLKLELWAIKG
jgi:type VI secretion system protein ImpJ